MQLVIIAGSTVYCAVSTRHTKNMAVHNKKHVHRWSVAEVGSSVRFRVAYETRPFASPRALTQIHHFFSNHCFAIVTNDDARSTIHNNRKRRRQDSDQDLSTPAPSAMSQFRGSREPSAARSDTILDPGFDQVPASNDVYPPSDHRPDPANLSYIAECITQLSHDDVQQLLAEAAVRHQDVFATLETKSEEAKFTRQEDKARIERHLVITYSPDQYYHDTSRAISTQLDAIE